MTDRCPVCGAPASQDIDGERVPNEGYAYMYCHDPDAAIRERVMGLTPQQLLDIADGVQRAGGKMMQWPSLLRAALLRALGVGE